MNRARLVLMIAASLPFAVNQFSHANSDCDKAKEAWEKVSAYQCTYRAVTNHDGKTKESLMTYTFQKPGKVRMDIQKPKKGAVLLYNPEISKKVRIRPFKSFKSMVLKYDLTHKRVSSGSGGTIDRSDLGNKIESVCSEEGIKNRKVTFGENGLLKKVEEIGKDGEVKEIFEWTNLKINPQISKNTFTDF